MGATGCFQASPPPSSTSQRIAATTMTDISNRPAGTKGLWRLTGNLIDLCFDYRITARTALENFDRINDQLVERRNLLEHLLKVTTTSDSPQLRWSESDNLTLESKCKAELEILEAAMKQTNGVMRGDGMPGSSSEIVLEALGNLDRSTRDLKDISDVPLVSQSGKLESSLSTTNNFDYRNSNTVNVLGDQVNYNISGSDNDLRQKIHRWLSPPDPSTNQNNAAKLREKETGLWLIDGVKFKDWKAAPNSLLWIHGIPGCGKTVMCSMIVEELGTHCQDASPQARRALAYFYFSFSDPQKQLSANLIRSLLMQFSVQCGSCPKPLVNLYSRCQEGAQQPSFGDLLRVLKQLIEVFDQAYIVIDGLDECNDQDDLLDSVTEIASWGIETLHVLCASRKEREIEDGILKLKAVQIPLDSDSVDRDIWTHLHARLREDSRFDKWTPKELLEIETALVQRAHGMFRWVACQLDALARCSSLHMLRKALRSLPKTLDETYERILCKISDENQPLVLKVLRWLAFSGRPMTLKEMAEILAIDDNDILPRYNPDQLLRDPRDILAICSSLVAVSNQDVLQLAHFSVKEYLVSERSQNGPASRYHLSEDLVSISICRDCLAYLLRVNPDEHRSLSSLRKYTADYWVTYAAHAPHANLETIQPLMIKLFEAGSVQFANWARLFDVDDRYYWHQELYTRSSTYVVPDHKEPLSAPSMPLYCASVLGLEDLARHLASGVSRDCIDLNGGCFGTALAAASYAGHERIVSLLLDKGADANAGRRFKATPLIFSCANGDRGTVQLLLKNNADTSLSVHGVSQHGLNALFVASCEGHADVVRLLLENGEDINHCSWNAMSALIEAVDSGPSPATVQALLDNGANTNHRTNDGETALTLASRRGFEEIVRVLLTYGADTNATKENGDTALICACSEGHENIAIMLLENRAEVNHCTESGNTALISASRRACECIVRILLDNGADVNACTKEGMTALIWASWNGEEYKNIVPLLLENGADVNHCSTNGETALFTAIRRDQVHTVRTLLENGADFNARPLRYGDMLASARYSPIQSILQEYMAKSESAGPRSSR